MEVRHQHQTAGYGEKDDMRKLIILAVAILLVGCSTSGIPEKLNGKVLKDSEGNTYIVTHKLFDIVHIKEFEYKEKF